MTSAVSSAPEQRFSNRVEDYVRYRPRYPTEVIELLRGETALTQASIIADIGSGTGISAELFLSAGCTVFAVEPNREMRAAAERLLGARLEFRSVDGAASATTLPDSSVEFIVAAQAFHWFNTPETRAEFSRILKPCGHAVLMWNERRTDATPFLRDYEQLLLKFATDYVQVRHENAGATELVEFFIGAYSSHSFPNEQRFRFPGAQGPAHVVVVCACGRAFAARTDDRRTAPHFRSAPDRRRGVLRV